MAKINTALLLKIGAAGAGAVLVAWLVLALFLSTESPKSKSVSDENHCPDCGRQLPKAYVGTGQCPYCELEALTKGKPAKPKRGYGSGAFNPLVPGSLIALLSILGGIHLGLAYRKRRAQVEDLPRFYFSCPKCKRKLRYRARQGGKFAMCPLCHGPIIFPKVPPPEKRWVRFKRWVTSVGRQRQVQNAEK